MKKTLALILCAIMLLASLPVCALAETTVERQTVVYTANTTLSEAVLANTTFLTNTDYIVEEGATLTIPSGVMAYLSTNSSLTVKKGATLIINGSLLTFTNSDVIIEGITYGAANISGLGDVKVQVRFKDLKSYYGANNAEDCLVSVSYAVSTLDNSYADITEELEYTDVAYDEETSIYVPLNRYIYIKAEIAEPDPAYDKFDDSLYNVYMNGSIVTYGQGAHYIQVTTAGDITYDSWKGEEYYYNTFKVALPAGEGYTVYSKTGEKGTLELPYGSSMSFRVEIDEAYDMSQYEVYVYNGYGWTGLDTSTLVSTIEPCQPDEYGYYTITDIKGDHTVYVVGVMANETISMLSNIMEIFRNVIQMLSELFGELFAMLGFSTQAAA